MGSKPGARFRDEDPDQLSGGVLRGRNDFTWPDRPKSPWLQMNHDQWVSWSLYLPTPTDDIDKLRYALIHTSWKLGRALSIRKSLVLYYITSGGLYITLQSALTPKDPYNYIWQNWGTSAVEWLYLNWRNCNHPWGICFPKVAWFYPDVK